MASFRVHLYGASAVSGLAALGAYSLGWAGPQQTQLLFLAGVVGGLLPDIDAEDSKPVRGFFTVLAVILAFWMSFSFVGQVPLHVLAGIWALVLLTVRFGVYELFARLTIHRGVWHSLLGLVFAALASANAAFHLGGLSAWGSWLTGFFVALGYLAHLCLDEAASVDLLGNRVRRSFGTALKPFSTAYPRASLAMLAAVLALGLLAPSLAPLEAAGAYYGLTSHFERPWTPGGHDLTEALRALMD
jgi:hypothetical protein